MASQPADLIELLAQRADAHRPTGWRYLSAGRAGRGERLLSFHDADVRARAIAGRLIELGYAGERALLLYPPGLDFLPALYGCLYAGVVAVPAYPPDPMRVEATAPRLRGMVSDCRPAVVLTTGLVEDLITGLANITPELAVLETLATDEIDLAWGGGWRRPDIGAEDLAFIQYTSGSTARPRGVMISHGAAMANVRLADSIIPWEGEGDVGVSWLPMFHDMGLISGAFLPPWYDGELVLLSPQHVLRKPLRWLQAISHYGAFFSGGPDFAYRQCVEKATPEALAGLDLSTWRSAVTGAEPVNVATLNAFAKAYAPAGFQRRAFKPLYGLAEATLLVTGGPKKGGWTCRDFDADRLKEGHAEEGDGAALVGCGAPVGETELRIVSPEGTPLPDGTVGEIWVHSPSLADGYWERPAESEATFGGRLDDGRRWLRTGDVGFLTGGELFITGRIKDLIIIRGRNHAPHDIELTVEASHEAVLSHGVAAFPIEGGQGEEALGIAAEVVSGAPLEAVEAAVRRGVSEAHGLSVGGLVLLARGTLPKTTSGKVQRRACRRAWAEGSFEGQRRSGPAPTRPAGLPTWIGAWLKEHSDVDIGSLRRGDRLSDLGLDSLSTMQLAGYMEERLGMEIPVEILLGRTVGDVGDWLETAGLPTGAPRPVDLDALARLPDDIVLAAGPPQGQLLLLTGATGFVGCHLLAALLRRFEGEIACLVRCDDAQAGRGRIAACAEALGLAVELSRVQVIPGDLAQPRWGLAEADFAALASEVGRIVHCGARVDWGASLGELAAPNVGGTIEAARLSALGGGIPLHHVSSLGVYPLGVSSRDAFEEQEDVAEGDLLRIPYFQSKWVAERALEQAGDRGLPVTIYRPGLVGGHSQTGAYLRPAEDLLPAFIAGVVALEQVPAVEKALDVVPVDFVAEAIAALSLSEGLAGKKLNLLNPSPLRQSDLYETLVERGYALRGVAFERWRGRILRLPVDDPTQPLARFALYYRTFSPRLMRRVETLTGEGLPIGDELAAARLREAGVSCPPFDRHLLQTYLGWLKARGFLPPPSIGGAVVEGANPHRPALLDMETLSQPWTTSLGSEERRLVRLYQVAKDRQWDAERRLDWSQELDPEDPEALGDEAVPIWGSPVWERMTPAERTEVRRHHQAWQLSQFLAGEQGALLCASRIACQAPTTAARLYSATQAVDEARHVEVFSRLLYEKVGLSYDISTPLSRLLDDVIGDRRWDVTCLGMQVLIEGLGLAAFSMVRDRTGNPLIRAAHAYICEDEARHVSFGRILLSGLYDQMTEAERREREDLLIESCYLLRDRFTARDVWERLGLPVERCLSWLEGSSYARVYRGELFRRIVPVVRRIGLWSPRVQETFHRLGAMGYADLDVEQLNQDDQRIAQVVEKEVGFVAPRRR